MMYVQPGRTEDDTQLFKSLSLSLSYPPCMHARTHIHTQAHLLVAKLLLLHFSIALILSEAYPSLPQATVYYPLGR